MALATRCPNCQSMFRVVSDQLKLRGGLVRCGNCRNVFDAIASLTHVDDGSLSGAQRPASPPQVTPPQMPQPQAPAPSIAKAPAPARAAADRPQTLVIDPDLLGIKLPGESAKEAVKESAKEAAREPAKPEVADRTKLAPKPSGKPEPVISSSAIPVPSPASSPLFSATRPIAATTTPAARLQAPAVASPAAASPTSASSQAAAPAKSSAAPAFSNTVPLDPSSLNQKDARRVFGMPAVSPAANPVSPAIAATAGGHRKDVAARAAPAQPPPPPQATATPTPAQQDELRSNTVSSSLTPQVLRERLQRRRQERSVQEGQPELGVPTLIALGNDADEAAATTPPAPDKEARREQSKETPQETAQAADKKAEIKTEQNADSAPSATADEAQDNTADRDKTEGKQSSKSRHRSSSRDRAERRRRRLERPTLLAAPAADDGAKVDEAAAEQQSSGKPKGGSKRSKAPAPSIVQNSVALDPASVMAESADAANDAPDFLRSDRARGFSIVFAAGSVLLGVLMVIQLAALFRTELLARWPGLRPALIAVCNVSGCAVGWPMRAELLAVVGTELQKLPNTEALELTAVVRNRAGFTVALPAIEVTLTDTQNRIVTRKVFAPVDYLASSGEQGGRIDEGLAAGSDYTVRVVFEARGITAAGFVVYPFYL